MSLCLLDHLSRHASDHPHACAVREIDPSGKRQQTLTWSQLHERVNELQRTIDTAVSPRSIIMLQCPNTTAFHIAFLAILAAGRSVLPVAPDATAAEVEAVATRSAAAAVIDGDLRIAALDIAESRTLGDPSLLLLSSGTTGQPKIVIRPAAAIDAVCQAMVESIGFSSADCVLATLPLCHSYGLEHGLLAPIFGGSTVHLLRGFELPAAMQQLTRGGITLLPAVPSIYEMIAQLGEADSRFPQLRNAYSAGAPLPVAVSQPLRDKYHLRVGQLYGTTEVGSITFNDPSRDGFDPASVGGPMRGVHVRILNTADPARTPSAGEEGHVAIRADSMFRGYIEASDAVDADGYFHTGDLGRLNHRGDLTITGRIKLLIDIGGLKVNPMEVEDVLAAHERVGACVVVPLRLSETVNRLKAVVTPRDPALEPDAGELRAFLRDRLSPYKIPRVFEVRPSLPRTATGKILRHLVQA